MPCQRSEKWVHPKVQSSNWSLPGRRKHRNSTRPALAWTGTATRTPTASPHRWREGSGRGVVRSASSTGGARPGWPLHANSLPKSSMNPKIRRIACTQSLNLRVPFSRLATYLRDWFRSSSGFAKINTLQFISPAAPTAALSSSASSSRCTTNVPYCKDQSRSGRRGSRRIQLHKRSAARSAQQ